MQRRPIRRKLSTRRTVGRVRPDRGQSDRFPRFFRGQAALTCATLRPPSHGLIMAERRRHEPPLCATISGSAGAACRRRSHRCRDVRPVGDQPARPCVAVPLCVSRAAPTRYARSPLGLGRQLHQRVHRDAREHRHVGNRARPSCFNVGPELIHDTHPKDD
jgi:hypothetical protein